MATLNEKRAEIVGKLKEYQTGLKAGTVTDKDAAAIKQLLTDLDDVDTQLEKAKEQADMVAKIGALAAAAPTPTGDNDPADGGDPKGRTLGEKFVNAYKATGNTKLKAGFAVELKANTDTQLVGDSTGAYGPYATQIETDAVFPYQRPLAIADLFGQGTMGASTNAVKYPVYGTIEGAPGMVGEAGAKPQLHFPDPEWKVDDLKEVAGWFAVSDNMLDDLAWLRGEITDFATYQLQLLEESQLLSGDGTDNNILGLLNRGVQELAQGADSDADRLFRTRTMIQSATGQRPDGIVINPADYETLRLSKDGNGQYYGGGYFAGQYGNGGVMQDPPLWGLKTVVTEAVDAGTAIVGAFKFGGKVLRKGGLRVESTNSHADYFTSDKVAIRLKERLTLQVKYPKAFVKVTLGKKTAAAGK